MGYFLLYESMLDTVLFARDKWLNNDGLILPDRCTMHVAAIEDKAYKGRKQSFWDDVYGIDMSCLTPATFAEPIVDSIKDDPIVSTEDKFFEIDLYTVTKEDLEFSSMYEIEMTRDDSIHGIVTWFDIFFGNMAHEVKFSTGPYDKYTHWKQTIFYFEGEYKVKDGDILKGSIACKKSSENFRACDIKISYHLCPKLNDFKPENSQVVQYKLR